MLDSMPLRLPCKVDAHVHLTSCDALKSIREAGITAVRDAGTKDSAGLALQHASTDLTIRSAGRSLSRKGGYGGLFGKGLENDAEIKVEIRTLHKTGAAIIKVMASGIVSLSDPGKITAGGFGADELSMIVAEARLLGLSVMAHANGEDAILHAARAGVRSIEHGFFMTESALDALVKNGIWWVPTVSALERAAAGAKISEESGKQLRQTITDHLVMIKKAHERGVKLALGTDAVLPDPRYGEYYDAELDYFRKAGLPDKEVARIACEAGKALLAISGKQ